KVAGQIQNMAVNIGVMFLPALKTATGLFSEFLTWLSGSFDQSKGTIQSFADSVTQTFEQVGVFFRNLSEVGQIVWIQLRGGVQNFLAVLAVLPTNLGIIAEYIAGNWRELIVDGVKAVISVFMNLGSNINGLSVALMKFFAGEGFDFKWTPLL